MRIAEGVDVWEKGGCGWGKGYCIIREGGGGG